MRELVDAIGRLASKRERPIVFVAGVGGAGKSTLCGELASSVGGVVVQLDWYLRYPTKERRRRIAAAIATGDEAVIAREENPQSWYDWDAFITDVLDLRATGRLEVRSAWAQDSGRMDGNVQLTAEMDSLIICDGIYLLHDPLATTADVTVLLEVDVEVARARAELRDSHRSDDEYLAYKHELLLKYDVPYFNRWASNADIRMPNNEARRIP